MINKTSSRFVRVLLLDRKWRVLVVRHKKLTPKQLPHYFFPGGKVEIGERPLQAAVRELSEEVGLITTQSCLKLILKDRFHFSGKTWTGYFYATVSNLYIPMLIESEKIDRFQLVRIDKLKNLPGDSATLSEIVSRCSPSLISIVNEKDFMRPSHPGDIQSLSVTNTA